MREWFVQWLIKVALFCHRRYGCSPFVEIYPVPTSSLPYPWPVSNSAMLHITPSSKRQAKFKLRPLVHDWCMFFCLILARFGVLVQPSKTGCSAAMMFGNRRDSSAFVSGISWHRTESLFAGWRKPSRAWWKRRLGKANSLRGQMERQSEAMSFACDCRWLEWRCGGAGIDLLDYLKSKQVCNEWPIRSQKGLLLHSLCRFFQCRGGFQR